MIIRNRQSRTHRGTAMVEMIMVIPLLATIIGVTYFFGWSWLNQQQVRVVDRYLAWRSVYGGGTPTQETLNSNFFDGRATVNSGNSIDIQSGRSVILDPSSTVLQTSQDFLDKVGASDQSAGGLATELLNQPWPGGHAAIVNAQFPSSIGLWNQYQGSITSRSGREGDEWRYRQATQNRVIADYYFENLNSTMDGVGDPASPMAQMIKRLYEQGW